MLYKVFKNIIDIIIDIISIWQLQWHVQKFNFAMKYFLSRNALTNDKKVKYINVTIMTLYISTEY